MYEKDDLQVVYKPRNLNELLSISDTNPAALIFAGGIEFILQKNKTSNFFHDYQYISLSKIGELARIARTERYLEIGAATPLSKILNIGKNIITPVLCHALQSTGNPALRNLATIGGNICAASACSTLIPVLFALDAKVEVRSINGATWMPISRFIPGSGRNLLGVGEILTRIRIPSGGWQLQTFRKLAARRTQRVANLVFCALARFSKNILTDIRFVYGALGPRILHNREYESSLIGSKLPLSEKDTAALLSEIHALLGKDGEAVPVYKRETSLRLTRWFLEELNGLV